VYAPKECRKCGVALSPGLNWGPSRVKKGERICKACLGKYNKANRATHDGFTGPMFRRLYEEDPWLYQCYRMLYSTGLGRTEENARRLYNEVLPRNHVCPCCNTAMVTTVGQGRGQGKRVAPRPDSPSIEHIIPVSHLDYGKGDEWDTLRVICNRCNTDLRNHTPARLRQLADWRHNEVTALGYNDELELTND